MIALYLIKSNYYYMKRETEKVNHYYCPWFAILLIALTGCRDSSTPKATADTDSTAHLFTLMTPEQTHVDFSNTLTEALNTNVLMYEYFYNGGGVATGDLNGDGLTDIYFTANMTDNKLYLNKGGLQF